MIEILRRAMMTALTIGAMLLAAATQSWSDELDTPPAGFTSGTASVDGTDIHYVRGGDGPAVILLHGFPENWVEYRAIMPELAKRFTVVAVDLPGVGDSAPVEGHYDAASLAARIHALADTLKLEHAYLVGHDLGGIVSYAYIRQFPQSLRGAMILDVPVPGIDGWDQATAGAWHIGFIQAPGLAEKMVPGKQDVLLGYFMDVAKFAEAQRQYYFSIYDAPRLHAAFEIYRGFPKDGEFNKKQTAPNAVPLIVAVGEKSFFSALLPVFVDGFKAKGMTDVHGANIPAASHYVLADNPDAVAGLIDRYAGGD